MTWGVYCLVSKSIRQSKLRESNGRELLGTFGWCLACCMLANLTKAGHVSKQGSPCMTGPGTCVSMCGGVGVVWGEGGGGGV